MAIPCQARTDSSRAGVETRWAASKLRSHLGVKDSPDCKPDMSFPRFTSRRRRPWTVMPRVLKANSDRLAFVVQLPACFRLESSAVVLSSYEAQITALAILS